MSDERTLMHIDSHYHTDLVDQPQFETLHGERTTQTCVIGGGFAGLTTARELARKGHDVVLVEAEQIAWGASGRNGGFVSAGFARSISSIAEKFGWEKARLLFGHSQVGRDYISRTIDELGLKNALLGHGWLRLLRHNNIDELVQYRDQFARHLGVELKLIEKNSLDQYVKSDRYHGGLYDDQSFHIQPLQYACGLAADINKHGGLIFENSRCTKLRQFGPLKNLASGKGHRWVVTTGEGFIYADQVVLATSAYGGPLAKLNSAMVAVATYVVSTAPCASILDEVIPFGGCIADTRRSGDYYRTIGSGDERRLIWGGRITTIRTQPQRLAQMLKSDMISVYPQLGEVPIERAWSGLMGYARHQMPIIGRLDDGLWAASAFGGQGLNTSAMAGLLISAAILDGDDTHRIFEPFGVRYFGGILGRLAVQMEYWRLQFLDRRDENS